MTAWTGDELASIGAAEEVQIAPLRRDGALGRGVTVWAVRHGDSLYVRSVKGRDGAWFRGIQQTHEGRIRAGRVEKDVTFAEADHEVNDEIDAAYRAKYRRYAGPILDSVLTPEARSTALKVEPR
ncbi:MAG TPA: DUF2255 family protein [Candidatus Dormibacteraeota bacterium]|nr:DUF2255 family protein [Candidatus Dormibacteraeota bacterium]